MWDLHRSRIEPMSPALAGRFFTIKPLGKPLKWAFICKLLCAESHEDATVKPDYIHSFFNQTFFLKKHINWTPWSKKWQPNPVFLPRKFHEQRNLAGYSPWGCKESNTTEQLRMHVHINWTLYLTNFWYIIIEHPHRKAPLSLSSLMSSLILTNEETEI